VLTTDTEFWKKLNWFAIQTKPRREDQAASNVRRLGVTVLLPKIKREKFEFGHRRGVIKPLFPGYLFARFSPSPHLHSIRYARGVARVLGVGETPFPVGDEIIGIIQNRLGQDGFVRIGENRFSVGDEVVINAGPLQGLVGVFERDMADGERATILLQAVQFQIRVLIDTERLSAPIKQ
jgi:transcriptional antiterminator RfaH